MVRKNRSLWLDGAIEESGDRRQKTEDRSQESEVRTQNTKLQLSRCLSENRKLRTTAARMKI
jgi:hypothetical protein